MWFLHRKVILTKDNLTKRKWEGTNIVLSAMHKRQSNIFSLSVMSLSYLHVFLLAPLLVYNATTGGARYYAQWCYTLGIVSQGSLIPLWVA
uniref:Uncharacterized protein n=1 Tax=Oryza glumipatula TaxID=40148 RepID=A0A0D9YD29_9ORYZ